MRKLKNAKCFPYPKILDLCVTMPAKTYQESIWNGKMIIVTGIMSKSGHIHMAHAKRVGHVGRVMGEAKNGMLLVYFGNRHDKIRAIPASCLMEF